jgi:uncharacterized membrane protein
MIIAVIPIIFAEAVVLALYGGISAGAAFLNSAAANVASTIQKRAAEGLREAVFKCGQLLSRHFPHQAGRDVNELPNTVRIYD